MKRILFLASLAFICSCNDTKTDSKSTTTYSAATDSVINNAPYKASYAAKFEIGDPKYSAIVLNLWKAWEDGNLSNGKEYFADSVQLIFANGIVLNGTRDSVFNTIQNYRNMYTGMKNTVAAYTSLKTVGMDHTWVDIWGTETSTDKSGKVDSMHLHEIWMFNKDGKISYVQQYAGSKTPPKM